MPIGQRLELEGKIGPTDEGSGGKRHFDGVFIGIGIAHEEFPNFIGETDHVRGDVFGKVRELPEQKFLFRFRRGITDFAGHVPVEQRKVLANGSLIEPRVVTASVGVRGTCDSEHFMRGNDLSSILRQTQRRTVQNTVEANGNFRGKQIRLIDQKNSPVPHGKRQWTVLIDHTAFLQGNMAAQIGKLQSSMPGDFKCGIVQPCGKLLDERRLPASSGAVQIPEDQGHA